ncbi:MAG TPA: STAS domain-containing protein [bacterium]|nr:STAS domain-containing protein [bacterium]
MAQIAGEWQDGIAVITVQGRVDAVGAGELEQALTRELEAGNTCLVLDMGGVSYLSSAGLRVFVKHGKALTARGGTMALAGLNEYCRQVVAMGGLDRVLRLFAGLDEARRQVQAVLREQRMLAAWDELETVATPAGTFRFIPGGGGPGAAAVLGDVRKVLTATVTRADISSKKFSETEYSIGLGGLGDALDDYYLLLGEMMTIGGTMVWLPCDGNDTPDFLIPKADTGAVTIRTGFNVALAGGFDELAYFTASGASATIAQIYRALFDLARTRRPDFRGAIGLALRAEFGAVYGSGIKLSPVDTNTPADGKMVIDPAHTKEWFDFDQTPRHRNITGLTCGIGVDLTFDLSGYDQEQFARVFYVNPANPAKPDQMLHNHAVLFSPQPMPNRAANLEKEIAAVVDNGEFVDMRHLLDSSTVVSGLLGISYVQEFRPDKTAGEPA